MAVGTSSDIPNLLVVVRSRADTRRTVENGSRYLYDTAITESAGVRHRHPRGFHHPQVRLHDPFIDAIRQHGEERLAGLVERHPHVIAILCGHAHTPAAPHHALPRDPLTRHGGNRAVADPGKDQCRDLWTSASRLVGSMVHTVRRPATARD
jgi:hypothetical protein